MRGEQVTAANRQLTGTWVQGKSKTGPGLTATAITGNASIYCPPTGRKAANPPASEASDSDRQQEALPPEGKPGQSSKSPNRPETQITGGPEVADSFRSRHPSTIPFKAYLL